MGNQASVSEIVIHTIKKCVNLSFVRSIAGWRNGFLRDPLRDWDSLDRTLMTSLLFKDSYITSYINSQDFGKFQAKILVKKHFFRGLKKKSNSYKLFYQLLCNFSTKQIPF